MNPATMVDGVRQVIAQTLAELRIETGDSCREVVLLRDGFYVGRRFEYNEIQIVWFVEECELKFFSESSGTVHVVKLAGHASTSSQSAA